MKPQQFLPFNNFLQIVSIYLLFLLPHSAQAQINRNACDAMKDNFMTAFNKKDYKAIYQLFDTSFSNKIPEARLVGFLKGNQNSGKIVNSSFLSENNGKASYLLAFELRDMILDLQVTAQNKISSFGLRSSPHVLLPQSPKVATNNPGISALDKAVDSIAREYFRNPTVNSLVIGIVKNGKKHTYFYGETEKGNGQLPSFNTLYEIGSITKTFTTTLLAQAVLEGKLALDDDIRKFLPGNFDNLTYNNKGITLRDLANHTSRLPTLPEDIGDYEDYNVISPEAHYDSSKFYQALKKITLDTLPGYKFLYSNWGITVLGHIIEKVYGQTQAELVKRFVTKPLKMSHTDYIDKGNGYNIAYPHSENGKQLTLTDQGYFSPAGGLCSTMEDMLKYLDAQLKESNASIRLTHVPTANGMGLGWGIREIKNTRHIEHNGSEQGSTAHISAFPELKSGCVILVNNKVLLDKLITGVQKIIRDIE